MLKKNKGPNKKKLFREIKKNIAVVKNNLQDIKQTNNEMLAHIDKINEIWNRERPEEIKAADEIQPDKLIVLLQEYVHREGSGSYEEARQRYIYESKRWAQLNEEIKSATLQIDNLRDRIKGQKVTLYDVEGKAIEAWVGCEGSDDNFDKHYKMLTEAHVQFGKSLAVLDKRIAAGIIFWNEIMGAFPREIPSDTGHLN